MVAAALATTEHGGARNFKSSNEPLNQTTIAAATPAIPSCFRSARTSTGGTWASIRSQWSRRRWKANRLARTNGRVIARWRLGEALASIERRPEGGRPSKTVSALTVFRRLLGEIKVDPQSAMEAQRVACLPFRELETVRARLRHQCAKSGSID